MVALLVILGLLLFASFIICLSAVINGYVLTILWTWFVVPFGISPINIPWAVGLCLILSLLTHQIPATDYAKEQQSIGTRIGTAVGDLCAPFIVLLFGYTVHHFFM